MFTNGRVQTFKAVVQILDDFRQQILMGYKKASGLSSAPAEQTKLHITNLPFFQRAVLLTRSMGGARKIGWKHRHHLPAKARTTKLEGIISRRGAKAPR